jgi:hypothetical protein
MLTHCVLSCYLHLVKYLSLISWSCFTDVIIFLYSKFVSTLDVFWNSFISAILTCADKIHIFIKVDYIIFLVCLYIIINMLKIKKFKKKMKIAEKITGLGIKDINVYLTFHIISLSCSTSILWMSSTAYFHWK